MYHYWCNRIEASMKIPLITYSWMALLIAIIFGALGSISMKLSYGLQKIKPSICLVIFYSICFIALTFSIKHIELSIVYAIWSGIGTVFVATIGIFYFNESISIKKIIFLSLIVIGVIGIQFK